MKMATKRLKKAVVASVFRSIHLYVRTPSMHIPANTTPQWYIMTASKLMDVLLGVHMNCTMSRKCFTAKNA